MLIVLEFFVLRLILSGLVNWVCLRFCVVIFSSFFPYYSPKPLHKPSDGNHGLDLRRWSPPSPSAADLHCHPAPYPSLLCAKRPILARWNFNRRCSFVGMFLDFLFILFFLLWVDEKGEKKKKKKKNLLLAKQRKKSLFLKIFFLWV